MFSQLLRAAHPAQRCFSSNPGAVETVRLAYDVWKPPSAAKGKPAASSTPIVFLHGLFGSKTNNRTVSKVLARDLGVDVYCLDLRNHGESPSCKRHDYVAMAADVHQFLEDHGIKKPAVIGHSMGARAAMALALTWPDTVSKLVCVDNGPVAFKLSPEFAQYVQGMREVDRAAPKDQKKAFDILSKYEKEPAVQQFLLSNFKRENGVYKSRIPLDILRSALGHIGEFNYPPSTYRFTGPTLLIRGTRSSFVPDEALPLMGELFPRFTVRDIPAGHWVISENPHEFIKVIEDFLDDKE